MFRLQKTQATNGNGTEYTGEFGYLPPQHVLL